MNNPNVVRMQWYQVPEVWLFMLLIVATVIGTFSMVAQALENPDRQVTVPHDVPRPSKIPPALPAAEPVDAPLPESR
jgi:hypothetical protein